MEAQKESAIVPLYRGPAVANVIGAYERLEYEVLLGNPDCLLTKLRVKGRPINASSAISLTDILFFQWTVEYIPWKRALVIGNSFGFSTFIIAALSPGCSVDAIDAEVEGIENRLGSEITREIARRFFPGVRLTTGHSPHDLAAACRYATYDLIFIDGLHTNEQLVADFQAVQGRRARTSIVCCHDVGIAKMESGWEQIKSQLLKDGDRPFDLHFTSFGSAIVLSGCPEFEMFMEKISRPLSESLYYFGSRHIGLRSACSLLFNTLMNSTRPGRALRKFHHRKG